MLGGQPGCSSWTPCAYNNPPARESQPVRRQAPSTPDVLPLLSRAVPEQLCSLNNSSPLAFAFSGLLLLPAVLTEALLLKKGDS